MKKSVITMLILLGVLMMAGLVSCNNNKGAGEKPEGTNEDTITQTAAEAPGAELDTVNTEKDPVAP